MTTNSPSPSLSSEDSALLRIADNAKHQWAVADDGTRCCFRCGMSKRPENVRMACAARPDGRGGWTLSTPGGSDA